MMVLEMLTVVSLLELGLGRKVRHGVQLHLRCMKKWWISGGGGRLSKSSRDEGSKMAGGDREQNQEAV